MWPHSLVLELGGEEVCVGSDDEHLLGRLAPWAVDRPGGLVDYGVELHPIPAPPRMPRVLPNLRHGSSYLAAAPDEAVLVDGLLRILGACANGPAPGEFMFGAVPVVNGDGVELMTTREVSNGSYRQLARRGRQPLLVDRVAIDPVACTARIAGPLGAADAELVLPIRALRADGEAPAGPESLAHLAARLAPRLLATAPDDASADLESLVTLVQRVPLDFTGPAR